MTEGFRQQIRDVVSRLAPGSGDLAQAEIEAVLARGIQSLDQLRAAIDDPSFSSTDRATICWWLGRLGDHDAIAGLQRASTAAEANVRMEAVRSLGALGQAGVVEPLIRALVDDPEPWVRAMAAQQLGLIGGESAFDALAAALGRSGEDDEVRSTCAESLGDTFEPAAVPLLLDALNDPSPLLRYDAALALGQLGDARALERLRELAEHDEGVVPGIGSVREQAAEAVARIEARQSPGIRPGESFADFARRTLEDDLLEHVDYLRDFVEALDVGERMPVREFHAYPSLWAKAEDGEWRILGPHPDTDVGAWERANRRMAANVLASWQRELDGRMSECRPRSGWRRKQGIDDWAQGEYYELAVFFDGDELGDFVLELPDDPAPMSAEERRALLVPRSAQPRRERTK